MYSTLSRFDASLNWTIVEINHERFHTLIPSIIYLCVLSIVGVVGNASVLMVYYRWFSATTHRTFILVLAFFDFIACAIGAPFAFIEPFFSFTYTDIASCKIFRFILYYTCIASSFTLVLIAYERYRKICTPLKLQFTVTFAKRALFCISGIIPFICSCPALILYGNATIATGVRNITGTRCFISDIFSVTHWPRTFNMFLLFLALLCTLSMAVCYTAIARQVSRMGKAKIARHTQTTAIRDTVAESSALTEDDSEMTIPRNKSLDDLPVTNLSQCLSINSNDNMPDMNGKMRLSYVKARKNFRKTTSKILRQFISSRGKTTLRLTKMLTLVTVCFVISYLPHMILMLSSLFMETEESLLKDNWYQIVFYSFLLNNLVNPFIYATMDIKFRREVKNLLTFRCREFWYG